MSAPQGAIPPPLEGEYAPFYSSYVRALPSGDVRELLEAQVQRLRELCAGLSDAAADHRYAPGKWSIKQVLGHLGDAERVFAYRLLRISRGDETPLAGFDENVYVAAADFDDQPIEELLDELALLRTATLMLIGHIPADRWTAPGIANGNPVTARALVHIIAGHMQHHTQILKERYGLEARTH